MRTLSLCDHAAMKIQAPCVVALTWQLSDAQGSLIDEATSPAEFLLGSDELLPKVQEALIGHGVGYETHLHLEPEHAFGEYDAAKVCFEPRALFPDTLEPGMTFAGLPAGAQTQAMSPDAIYAVTEIYPEHVVLDGNHPLAGMALRLSLKVHAVRAATEEEVAAGGCGQSWVVAALPTPQAPPAGLAH